MPKNVELLDNTNDKLYPKTKAGQVIVTSTKNLDVKLTEVDTKIKDVTDEVVNARPDKKGVSHPTLKARLDAMEDTTTTINNTVNSVKQEVEQARGGEANLNDRLDKMTTATTNAQNTATQAQQTANTANNTVNSVKQEIDNAKAPNATLKEKIDSIEDKFDGYLPLAGGTMTGTINYDLGGKFITSTPLQQTTTNGDVLTVDRSIVLGNENTQLDLATSTDVIVATGGQRYRVWHEGNAPISVPTTADTLVKRRDDGWINNGGSGIVANTIRSGGINVLIGGNDTDGTYTGDVVFMTNMRPTNERNIRIGSYNYKFSECWVTAGAFNTSDERCKTNIETFDIQDCFNMVKNTEVKSYTLLFGDKTKMSDNELQTATVEQESKNAYQQLGIIAQDIVDYKCSDYILVQDNPEDLYAINPYNLTSAVMGALKVEIQKREELEERVKQLAEEVKALKNA